MMSDHKCTKWFQGYCVDCQIHYTDCIESLQAKHTGLLKWAEGAKLDNEGLKAEIATLKAQAAEYETDKQKAKDEAVTRALNIHDLAIDHMVKSLSEHYGYGAVMDSAARQWALKDSIGAFYIAGECLYVEDLKERTRIADMGDKK